MTYILVVSIKVKGPYYILFDYYWILLKYQKNKIWGDGHYQYLVKVRNMSCLGA